MIRLTPIGAAVFALAAARAADVRRPARGAGPAHAPRHARPAAGRQPRRGRRDRPGGRRRRRRRACRPRGAATRPAPTTPPTPPRRRQGAVQGRLRVRRRPPEPLRRLEGRAPGQRGDRPALPVRPGRRHEGAPLRHGHRLRRRSTWTSRSSRCPAPRAAYADNFSAISSAVQRALGAAGGPRNAVVLADGLSGGHAGVRAGRDDHGRLRRAAGRREHPQPRRATSILFSRDGAAAPGAARWGWWPEGFLHEMTHNLGAVQWGAPHSTQPRRPAAAVRPLLAGRRRHVLRRGRRCRARDAEGLRRPPGRDPAELRLRPRRLLQPGAGRRLLPGDALEHLRLGVPGAVR